MLDDLALGGGVFLFLGLQHGGQVLQHLLAQWVELAGTVSHSRHIGGRLLDITKQTLAIARQLADIGLDGADIPAQPGVLPDKRIAFELLKILEGAVYLADIGLTMLFLTAEQIETQRAHAALKTREQVRGQTHRGLDFPDHMIDTPVDILHAQCIDGHDADQQAQQQPDREPDLVFDGKPGNQFFHR